MKAGGEEEEEKVCVCWQFVFAGCRGLQVERVCVQSFSVRVKGVNERVK